MTSSVELPDHAERRWVIVGVGVALSLLVVQVVAGYARQAVFPGPSFLQKVERCLVERKTPFAQVTGDPIAQSAQRGALRTRVQGDAKEKQRLFERICRLDPVQALTSG